MKRAVLASFALALTVTMNGQSPSFKTYMNPVIPGDHPDCTVTKVGNDFYTTGSSFNPTPVIYHSTDLVHWEAIAQPVSSAWLNYGDSPGGGCWGGHIVFYNGKWWNYFSRANTMYFVKADDPKGPWCDPVKVNNPSTLPYGLGYDNSLFIDDDNKWYLVVKNGQPNNGIVELGSDGQPTGVVYNLNWLNPSPNYPYSWAEGPVMWKYNGYYYYSFARDVAGGQTVMCSKTLTADRASWKILGNFFKENDPLKSGSLFASPNHASPAIMLNDSTSWVIHPLYAKDDWRGQGRQGLLNQVRYGATDVPVADYPINQSFTAPNLPSSGIPWMVPKSDFFSAETLNPEWSFLGFTSKSKFALTDRPGWLRLSPKSTIKANTVIKNDGEHNYSLITRVDFSAKSKTDEAGIRIIRSDETKFVKLYSTLGADGKKKVVFSFDATKYETDNVIGDTLWLKIARVNHRVSAYFGSKGTDWLQVGEAIDVSVIDSYSDFSTWIGTRQGLYVAGKTDAYFDLYIYRDAFTPILAECPANQFGTSRGSMKDGIRTLDNIHSNDWALYAGVEFGNGEYYDTPDSVEFIASSASSGGTVEIWLDSIETGRKISECVITNTGSLTEFKTFKSAISKVSGIHDVYLRFVGADVGKLFILKWMQFSSSFHLSSSSTIADQSRVLVYPNPVKDKLVIDSNFKFNSVSIVDVNGKTVFNDNLNLSTNNYSFAINLDKGLYFVKVSNGVENSTIRIIVE